LSIYPFLYTVDSNPDTRDNPTPDKHRECLHAMHPQGMFLLSAPMLYSLPYWKHAQLPPCNHHYPGHPARAQNIFWYHHSPDMSDDLLYHSAARGSMYCRKVCVVIMAPAFP